MCVILFNKCLNSRKCRLFSYPFLTLESTFCRPLDAISNQSRDEKKKKVPKDVFGRALPTEEQFEILKNAPRYV